MWRKTFEVYLPWRTKKRNINVNSNIYNKIMSDLIVNKYSKISLRSRNKNYKKQNDKTIQLSHIEMKM